MTARERDTLGLFLTGRLTGGARDAFLAQAGTDPQLRGDMEKESAFEAAAYSLSWGCSAGSASDLEFNGKDAAPADPFSELEWQSCVDAAFARHETGLPQENRIAAFPRIVRYLAAACLAVVVTGIFVRIHLGRDPDLPRMVAIGRVQRDTVKFPPADKKSDTVVTKIAFDSLVIYSARDVEKKPVRPGSADGFLKLGDRTAVLLDKNSSLKIRRQLDSAVALDLISGSALFTVERKRYLDFLVYTPLSEIRVTGTIFKVTSDKRATVVSVHEGSVEVRRTDDTGAVRVPAGMSCRITASATMREGGDSAATMPCKGNLLRDFLEENGVWENGCFIRTGLSITSDTAYTRAQNTGNFLHPDGSKPSINH